jgi:hypothetical protein
VERQISGMLLLRLEFDAITADDPELHRGDLASQAAIATERNQTLCTLIGSSLSFVPII